jgi:lysophospholipase L1-like esterase
MTLRIGTAPSDTSFALAQRLPRWRAARALQRAGARNARALMLGDSTTWGYGAGGASFAGNLKDAAVPAQLARLLGGSSSQSYFGNGDVTALNRYPGADSRISPGSWGVAGGSKIGIGLYPYLATAASTFAFTPVGAIDTIEIYYPSDPTFGTFTVNVDGGASLGTVNCAQATGFRKTTFTVALATHTINCIWASGSAYKTGIVAYNSAQKEISVINAGVAGANMADIVAPPSAALAYSPLNSLPLLGADLVIANLTVNDANYSTDLATYGTRGNAFAAAVKATGADALFLTGVPTNPAKVAPVASFDQQRQYIDVYMAAAAANDIPVLDVHALFKTFAAANARGLMIDDIHPNALGYGLIAGEISRLLLAA